MSDITDLLEEATRQNKRKWDAIQTIRNTDFKKVGLRLVVISEDEKIKMYNKVQQVYGTKINDMYREINEKLTALGEPTMQNPFKERKINTWN